MAIFCSRFFSMLYLLCAITAHTGLSIDRRHLDPLSEDEILVSSMVLKKAGLLGNGWYMQHLALDEPEKTSLYGPPFLKKLPRKALAVVLNHKQALTYECFINLSTKTLTMKKAVIKGQPGFMPVEAELLEQAIKKDPRWQEAMRKRGFNDFNQIYIEYWAPGDLRLTKNTNNHRVFRNIFYFKGSGNNPYSRPIEGISTLTDLNDNMKVTVIDSGIVPLTPRMGEIFSDDKAKAEPSNFHPENTSIIITGHQITWKNFHFHASIHPREGLVISALSFIEDKEPRPILHRASLAEMVVPYGDIHEQWYWKAAFDEGEYSIGSLTTPLKMGVHAPKDAHYRQATLADNHGGIVRIPRALAIFERHAGPLWSHYDSHTQKLAAIANKELVVLHMFTVGNYDYGVEWIFREDGSIKVKLLLTGILAVKGTDLTYCARCQNSTDLINSPENFGTLVDNHLLGVSHQHFFTFRLDFAIDGFNNQVAEMDFKPISEKASNPYGNAFILRKEIITKEKLSGRMTRNDIGRRWLIYNPNQKNRLGHFSGYMLMPSSNIMPLAKDGHFLERAPFLTRSLWVTRYHKGEVYPAGDYPNQGQKDGIITWIERDASLLNTDVVVWYNLGINHLPHAEEWPIMPVSEASFMLKPAGFFDRNHTALKETTGKIPITLSNQHK